MSFVKKQVNLFLVFIIVGGVAAIAGLTLYYQGSFQAISSEYTDISRNASVCHSTLSAAQAELYAAQLRVQENQQDVDKTVSLFEEKNQELSATQGQLTQANSRITSLQDTVAARDRSITELNVQLRTRDAEIVRLGQEIERLKRDINDLRDDLDAC